MKKIIGIDLGGTTTKFAIVTTEGEIEKKWSIDTNTENDGINIIPNIIDSIKKCLEIEKLSETNFLGIGMGSPGCVDRKKGTVSGAYNLNWCKLQPVKEQVERSLGIKLYIDNDANVAALGEQWQGAGDGNKDIVFITLGTGVGGGIITNGSLLHGAGFAGEIGHINVDPYGYKCTCGNVGCLETVASATGIIHLAKEFSTDYTGDSQLNRLISEDKEVTAKMIFDHAKINDQLAEIVIDKFCFYLGLACSNIANILHPETIVIGGGVSAAGELLVEKINKYFNKYTFPSFRGNVELKIAQLGNDAGVIGAASLVNTYRS